MGRQTCIIVRQKPTPWPGLTGTYCYILMDINKIVTRDELAAMAEDMIDLGKDLH
ncbi:MAG: hypothetical protein ACLTBV_21600 [Enterocloster bolteae]